MGFGKSTVIACAAFAAATPTLCNADLIDTSCLGGTGSWHNPAQWSGGVLPNNSGSTTFQAFIPTGSVNLPAPAITIDSLNLDPPATLNISSSLTVDSARIDGNVVLIGTGVSGAMAVGPPGSLSGFGTIFIGPLFAGGWLRSSGSLDIPNGLNVQIEGGQYVALMGSPNQPFVNHGHIFGGKGGSNFRPIVRGSPFSNLGTIEARNGCISFGGSFTRDDLGTLVWGPGGAFGVGIEGTLLNQNKTFKVDPAHPWELVGGTIRGGTLEIAPGSALLLPLPSGGTYYGGTLDNVTVNGRISHFGAASLDIRNGTLAGNADIFLGPAPIEGPPRLVTSSPTLTLSSSVLIHGGGGGLTVPGRASGVGDGLSAIVNHGMIRSEFGGGGFPSEFDLLGTSIFNDGMLSVSISSFIYAAGASGSPTTLTFGPGGVLEARWLSFTRSLLQIDGLLNLSTPQDSISFVNLGPQPTDFIRIVTTTSGVLGQFDSVTLGFELMYSGNDIFARVVPEPSAMIMCMTVPLLLRRRRVW